MEILYTRSQQKRNETAVTDLRLYLLGAPRLEQDQQAIVESQLCPTLDPDDIVVLDNLSAHKSARISQLIAARGARLEYLPPYSADFNPIELCWAKVKAALRAAKARTLDALIAALANALRAVTPQDVQAWFAHCGYGLP